MTVLGKRRLWIGTRGDVLDNKFDVAELTARGANLANSFAFQAVVIDVLSGVPERLEPKAYQVLREVAGLDADNKSVVFGEVCYDTIV